MEDFTIGMAQDEEDYCDVAPVIKKIFPNSNLEFSPSNFYFFAKVKKQIVGFAHVIAKENSAFVLQGIGVLAEFRGRGIGGRLADTAIEFCEKKRALKIFLQVQCTNPAILLYLKKGFYVKKVSSDSYTLERREPS